MPTTTAILFWLNAISLPLLSCADLRDSFPWVKNSVSLPFPTSDLSANYMKGENGDEDGFIVVFGGCDSPEGNQRNKTNDLFTFYCTSVTNATYIFNPFKNTFQRMADAPHPRYRHVAAIFNGELYVLGGRDLADNLVTAIDSFNPKNNTWTTRGNLPDTVATSDAAGWSTNKYIYYAGGYDTNYTAKGDTFQLDVSQNPTSFDSMDFKALSTMKVPRGDLSAEVAYGYAYLVGGTSDVNQYCVSMNTVEQYDIATDTWSEIKPLNVGVDDSAVALLRGKIISVGGETKHWDCAVVADPAFGSSPDNLVESLDVSLNATTTAMDHWALYSDFPFDLMRFDAAAVPAQGRIYTFGGQKPFNETCQCFAATDAVLYGTESYSQGTSAANNLSPGAIASISIAVIAAAAVGSFLTWRFMRKDKEYSSSD